MRLLSTDRAELHFFPSPEDVPGGYAILSHVWDECEDTFKNVETLRVRYAKSKKKIPRDRVSEKIRQSYILAEKHGYRWLWVDTCCIDKSSSSELSEAINSMYRYYALSTVCYAFLRDAKTRDDMRRSVWYGRGWTLQELIAPKLLLFVSKKWEVLGTKGELAREIASRTDIPEDVLRYETDLAQVPVGQRMSWASYRVTTRVEDRAYSLMGIFGINMPTLYGEGNNAFYRLQEEIMKVSTDPTLFAWGAYAITTWSVYDHAARTPELSEVPDDAHHTSSHSCDHALSAERALLAPSPSHFAGGEMYLPAVHRAEKSDTSASILDHDVPSFEITPHGILANLPVVERPSAPHTFIALLTSSRYSGGKLIGLPLFRCFHAGPAEQKISVYHVGERIDMRIIVFAALGRRSKPRWTKLYILGKPPFRSTISTLPAPLAFLQLVTSTPFRIPGGAVDPFVSLTHRTNISINRASETSAHAGWRGSPPLAVQCLYSSSYFGVAHFLLKLGCCQRSRGPGSSQARHWAMLKVSNLLPHDRSSDTPGWRFTDIEEDDHRCYQDHIDQWPKTEDGRWAQSSSMTWGHESDRLVVSFSTCLMNPRGTTLVLKMELMSQEEFERLTSSVNTKSRAPGGRGWKIPDAVSRQVVLWKRRLCA